MTEKTLTDLFEEQRKLDAEIERKHPQKEGEDRLAKKILALSVELGECANEWRGFKFWSENQRASNKLLEEYVDCLHFILSIGNDIGESYFHLKKGLYREDSIEKQFLNVTSYALGLQHDDYCAELLQSFVDLGEMLGFTWEQVVDAYEQKNAVNHQRQESGY